jgi:hypothetical protein
VPSNLLLDELECLKRGLRIVAAIEEGPHCDWETRMYVALIKRMAWPIDGGLGLIELVSVA